MARRLLLGVVAALILAASFVVGWLTGRTGIGAAVAESSLTDVERQFTERMRGSALVGHFTVAGREDRGSMADRYDLSSVVKVGDGLWRFDTRMRHGDTDMTLPITVPMRFIGDTPVVMLTDYTIPTLGTFTARVMFDGDRYAGTWQHGRVGGLMYGRIEKGAGGTP